MKRFMALGLLLITFIGADAQSSDAEFEFYQTIFGMEKRSFVTNFIKLDETNSKKFWALYDEYEEQRQILGTQRVGMLNEYVELHENMEEKAAADILDDFVALSNKNRKLIKKYSNKIKKEVSSTTSLQFFQVEAYFQSAIRIEVLNQMPSIGKMVK